MSILIHSEVDADIFQYPSFVDWDMLMRYHWGLGVGHVGMGASCSTEDSPTTPPSQTVPGDSTFEEDESVPETTYRGREEHNAEEDNSEGEDGSKNSLGSDSDESDSGSEDLRQDRRTLDLHNMYGDKEKNQTSYD